VLGALGIGVLAGVPLVAVALPAVVRIPKVKPHPEGAPQDEALFSHRAHGRFTCYSCHPSVFPQAPLGFTHEEMRRGEFCGHCHDGTRATAVLSMPCVSCHEPR
jgi:c(7)-type cytochrome triheme protein